MLSAPLVWLSLSLAAAPPLLDYTVPEEPESPAVGDYHFTPFEPSAQPVYVGADEANLREGPSGEARSLTTLPLGAAVRVLKKGADTVKQGDYVNVWYQVETVQDGKTLTGWLFGSILTPFCFEADFDGDGEQEVATVVMSGDFKIRVRVREPNRPLPYRVSSVDVEPSNAFSFRGGPAKVKLVPARTAGLPLLQVDSKCDSCAKFSTTYVSYTQSDSRKKGGLGKARVAVSISGMVDEPLQATSYDVSFKNKGKRLDVLYTSTFSPEEGDGWVEKKREVYEYREGEYVKQSSATSRTP